jgi:Leucine-rich repeat (LRR) protein/GTPase SAR1 family protein
MARDQAYLEAEKKIEKVLKSGATELDLSSMKLTELPESIGQLKQLRKLDLGRDFSKSESENNQLTALPDALGQLMQLTELNLSSNQLTTLPEPLGQLTQLQTLNLSDNQLTALPDSLGQLTQLTELHLSNNQLTALPDSLGQLTHLQSLDLSSNKMTTLPDSLAALGALTQLTNLDLSGNQLTELPEWLGRLTQLQSLMLSHNQLTMLPELLRELTQIQFLSLSGNQLTELPECLGMFTQLTTLVLSDNSLITLPESLRNLTKLEGVYLYNNKLSVVPDWIGELELLDSLSIGGNRINNLPESLINLKALKSLFLGLGGTTASETGSGNPLSQLPTVIRQITSLTLLRANNCNLKSIPDWLNEIPNLNSIFFESNDIVDIPSSLAQLRHLNQLDLDNNPLIPELAEAYAQGVDAVKLYLRAGAVVPVYEAKLILVGEGEVGKTCLMDALLDKEWQEHPSTHGIEIQQIKVSHDINENDVNIVGKKTELIEKDKTQKEITLNGWDFGGQRVYRPTHQLFFSAPAVYLVVWKPREGPQQGFVKEWIQLVKRREPSAKIIVVATHGGPQQRQPDIDRQELWDLFGKETVVGFFFVDSKPNENGKRKGIEELKLAIAKVAADLPEVGRSVPKSFQEVRETLEARNAPYLPLGEVLTICNEHKMDDEIARLFITISHRLGHLTHYENDPTLRDIVILRPDWLATAMSYVLDDEETRKAYGLVKFSRLSQLWNNPSRPVETQYPGDLHRIFLRLMERFDLSYRVAGLSKDEDANPISLIAQLVPDNTPEEQVFEKAWLPKIPSGDIQQTQICRIVDEKGNSANAEGLFFQLIVRLHKFSLGRTHYDDSMHWQRGLVLDDEYNGRALLRHIGNDVHITVRAPYPEFFLAMLTREVKYLVESFWEGLRCDVMVPCIEPCGRKVVGTGLYEVEKLIDSKRKGRPEFPCPVCNEWQNIDSLLRNAPAAQPISIDELLVQFNAIKDKLDVVDVNTRRVLSQVDKTYTDLLQVLTDEAKEGPRLFSLFPLERSNFNPKNWIRAQFRFVLWCEHSRLPLPVLNGLDSEKGVYDLELDREWFKKAAPYLKLLTGTLSLVLPVASSTLKVVDNATFKTMEDQLGLAKSFIDGIAGENKAINEFIGEADSTKLEHGVAIHAENASLRELHALLKAKDPSFGGLVRVMNKRQEFLWVHEKFAGEY